MGFLDSAGLRRFFDRLKPRLVTGLTQAEYDALPDAARSRGLFVITDAGGSGGVKTASGRYVGNGDSISNTIQVGFRPKLFVCTETELPFVTGMIGDTKQAPDSYGIWFEGLDTLARPNNNGSSVYTVPVHASENGIVIGRPAASRANLGNTARFVLNTEGTSYSWFAIGCGEGGA